MYCALFAWTEVTRHLCTPGLFGLDKRYYSTALELQWIFVLVVFSVKFCGKIIFSE
jgi:hypothetical protein